MESKDIIKWMKEKIEFIKKDFENQFKIGSENVKHILDLLIIEDYVIETNLEDGYMISSKLEIFTSQAEEIISKELKKLKINGDYTQKADISNLNDWEDVREIEKLVIFSGSERIYDIHIQGKIIRLEGKEIMDYNVFRLRFFEEFGRLLSTYRGIGADWANLVSYWYRVYGEISKEKIEVISDIQEAREMIIDYINNCTISDTHIVKEGMISIKDSCIYVPTKVIKKLLKRENLNVSLRKLAYLLNDCLLSGSIPLKIENKSERFWKFKKDSFNVSEDKKIEMIEDDNE